MNCHPTMDQPDLNRLENGDSELFLDADDRPSFYVGGDSSPVSYVLIVPKKILLSRNCHSSFGDTE